MSRRNVHPFWWKIKLAMHHSPGLSAVAVVTVEAPLIRKSNVDVTWKEDLALESCPDICYLSD